MIVSLNLLLLIRQLLFQQSGNIQTRGLLVALLVKACGLAPGNTEPSEVVRRRHQLIISATEEFHAAQTIHCSATNLMDQAQLDPLIREDIQMGNKMTVLAGDYFFSKAFQTTTDIGIPMV